MPYRCLYPLLPDTFPPRCCVCHDTKVTSRLLWVRYLSIPHFPAPGSCSFCVSIPGWSGQYPLIFYDSPGCVLSLFQSSSGDTVLTSHGTSSHLFEITLTTPDITLSAVTCHPAPSLALREPRVCASPQPLWSG